jgi:hypothetical protein
MRYCVVRYGGSASMGSIYCDHSSSKIQNCRIAKSSNYGIECNNGSPEISGNTLQDNLSYPLYLYQGAYPQYPAANVFTGNWRNAVGTAGNKPAGTGVWHDPGYPYVVMDDAEISSGATLTIDPGVIVKFEKAKRLTIRGDGGSQTKLIAVGAPGDSIVFTSIYDDSYGGDTEGGTTPPRANEWNYIQFYYSNCNESIMRYCVVRYGGSGGWGNLYCDHSNPPIRNCRVEKSSNYGIACNNGSPEISGNTLRDNLSYPVYIYQGAYPQYLAANLFAGNWRNAVGTAGNKPTGTGVWHDPGYPYVITDNPDINGTLTIDPGVIVKFEKDRHFSAFAKFSAVGTPQDSIVFTSIYDDAYGGDTDNGTTPPHLNEWDSVHLYGTGANESVMKFCILRYCGHNNLGSLHLEGSNPTIQNIRIEKSVTYGIYCSNSSAKLRFNSLLGDTTWCGVYNATTSMTIDADSNWWGADNGPYDPSSIAPHYNPHGKGCRVSNYVHYIPWLSGLNPTATIYPGSIDEDVLVGSTKQINFLLVRNDGVAALAYTVHEANYFAQALENSAKLSGKDRERIMQSAMADIPWMSLSPTSGELAQGQSVTATLTFNASGLSEGTYHAYLVITSNDPEHDYAVIAITMNVGYLFARFPSEDYSVLRGNKYEICWSAYRGDYMADTLHTISIYLSSDNGRNYNTLIASNIPPNRSDYSWNVQQSVADSCKIMIRGYYTGGVVRSGYSDEIFRIIDNLPTDVPEPETPRSIVLQQNYPNPFNPITNITFFLPERTHVQLEIYTAEGRKVATLLNNDQSAGWHNLRWNGSEKNGASATSGIYFLRLETGSKLLTKKMILLR